MNVNGLWIAILLGTSLALTLYLTLVLKTDWQEVANEAVKRIEKNRAELLDNNDSA